MIRAKSPFRSVRSRSKSPFRGTGRRRSKSPFPSLRRNNRKKEAQEVVEDLHESEINIFQQLCLDRHDDNAAIEILLEESGKAPKTEVPDLFTASSGSTDRSSRGSLERKKTFLNRLFKSPRKAATSENTKFPISQVQRSPADCHSSENSDSRNYLPKPPSTVSKTRVSIMNLNDPVKLKNRVLSERFDTYSNMSSLSGTRASNLGTPLELDRHESLGTDSIMDIRKSLKEMEKQLGHASHKGERVSRRKVMRALFTVADSLEDMEERDTLRKELEGLMRRDREESPLKASLLRTASSDDEKSEITSRSDDDDLDTAAFERHEQDSTGKENEPSAPPPFNLFSSVGKMFSVSADDKKAVEQALDDLLWTEFVASRNTDGSAKGGDAEALSKARKASAPQALKSKSPSQVISNPSRRTKKSIQLNRATRPHQDTRETSQRLSSGQQQLQRGRSWWRRHPTTYNLERRTSYVDDEGEDDEEDEDSWSSEDSEEEYPAYLPSSIAVRNRQGNLESRVALASSVSFSSNPRYQVKLVDTESRYGYEMASADASNLIK